MLPCDQWTKDPEWIAELSKDEKRARDFYHPNDYELVPYLVDDGKKHPFAIICPGGAYGMVCSYVEGEPFARKLNSMGIHAFVLYYHVRDKALYPAPQEDLARAVREVHERAEQWKLDTRNYSVWGSSAGGHLAASFGTEAMGYPRYNLPKPGALVLIYPVVSMGPQSHPDTRMHLLGEAPSAEAVYMASVEKQVTHSYPATFLWCGNGDQLVPPDNSRMLAAALAEHGIPYEYVEYPEVDHGVGLGTGLVCEDWLERAVAFWREQRTP